MVFSSTAIGLVIGLIWLICLTIVFFRLYSHYNNLTKGISTKTLKSILDHVLKEIQLSHNSIRELRARCDKLEKESLFHVQKVGLLRFNPFRDTGGDQSFILALLDSNDSGVVISGLFARSGMRWYAKRVIEGKSVEHELSEEEKKTIKEAKVQK